GQVRYRPSPRARLSITKWGTIGVYQFDLKMAVVAIHLHLVANVSNVSKFQVGTSQRVPNNFALATNSSRACRPFTASDHSSFAETGKAELRVVHSKNSISLYFHTLTDIQR